MFSPKTKKKPKKKKKRKKKNRIIVKQTQKAFVIMTQFFYLWDKSTVGFKEK